MRLGLFGARMDNSGLGYQTWEFFKHMKPDKTLVVDISALERLPERVMPQYPERYPGATIIHGFPNDGDIRQFLQELDIVFIAESAYNNDFYRIAKEYSVKVVNQYNYEFFDWKLYPQFVLPDMFMAPSTWNYDDIDQFSKAKGVHHVYLHCPVNRNSIKRRSIDEATLFVHIAGRPAAHDRNGTYDFIKAIELADGQLKGVVYTQDKALADEIEAEHKNIKVKFNVTDYREMYKKGSVLVLPRKYGGNCLPMNEALAAGMPVIMTKLSPQIDFLPEKWLVAAHETDVVFAPRFKIPVYQCNPVELMLKMRWFASLDDDAMREQSDLADSLASEISWAVMAPKYKEVFEALCQL